MRRSPLRRLPHPRHRCRHRRRVVGDNRSRGGGRSRRGVGGRAGCGGLPGVGDGQPRRRHGRGPASGHEGYGVTKATLGADPIEHGGRSSSPRPIAMPVFTDARRRGPRRLVVNRVKPHTDFHGPYESGLMKMTAIGLGKRVQAELLHAYGTRGLRGATPRVARSGSDARQRRPRRGHRRERARADDGGGGRASGRDRSRPSRACWSWPARTCPACRSTNSTSWSSTAWARTSAAWAWTPT